MVRKPRGRHRRLPSGDGRVTYLDVLRVPEFRAVYMAQALSLAGDQVARIAVALLVFAHSHSALLTAASYAATYLTWLVAGPLLSTLADRFPRRSLMIVCDLARAVLVIGLTLDTRNLAVVFPLLVAVTAFEPPFQAARAAMVPDLLTGPQYGVGLSLVSVTTQFAQVVGYGVGGVMVGLVSVRGALLFDAATFALSAALAAFGVRHRPAPAGAEGKRHRMVGSAREAAVALWRQPALRAMLALIWLSAMLAIVPEGLAVVYAHHHGGGAVSAGVLTATLPAGQVIGAMLVGRFCPTGYRSRLLLPLALVQFLALIPTVADPSIAGVIPLWVLCGIGASFGLLVYQLFVAAVGSELRGRAFGLANTGITTAIGVGLIGGGLIADYVPVDKVVGAVGLLGTAGVLVLWATWPHTAVTGAAGVAFPSSSPPPAETKSVVIPEKVATR